jgi:hypothetical protein
MQGDPKVQRLSFHASSGIKHSILMPGRLGSLTRVLVDGVVEQSSGPDIQQHRSHGSALFQNRGSPKPLQQQRRAIDLFGLGRTSSISQVPDLILWQGIYSIEEPIELEPDFRKIVDRDEIPYDDEALVSQPARKNLQSLHAAP